MNTLVIGSKVVTVVNEVGISLIIRTLTTVTSNIISISQKITSYDQPYAKDVIHELNKLDLEYNISIMDCLVKEHADKDLPMSVHKSLESVSNILEFMHNELNTIHALLKYHDTLFLNSWRVLDCTANINKMKDIKIIFDERYKLLISLLQIK